MDPLLPAIKLVNLLWSSGSDLWRKRKVRNRESLRARQMLQKQLKLIGSRKERRRQIAEWAESFSVHFPGGGAKLYNANELVAEVVKRLDMQREGFMIASETGNGKTVLALLLPMLCQQSGAAALYLGPDDWDTKRLTGKVKDWISGFSPEVRKLIVFDSLDEYLGDGAFFQKLLNEVREHSPENCGFVVLFRPLSARYAEDISILLAEAFQKRAVEMRLQFDLAEPRHCAPYCHRFQDLSRGQASFLLRAYSKLFTDYRPTRMSAVHVLQHLVDRFRQADDGTLASGELLRPPEDVLFDAILGSQIDLDDPAVRLLSRVAFIILRDGRHTTTEKLEFLSAKLGQASHRTPQLADSLVAAKQLLSDAGSLITLLTDHETVRIPSETDVQVLAALHVARLFETAARDPMPRELEQLYGTEKYDVCAQFVLPAWRHIRGARGALFQGMDYFLNHEAASFSFCARLLHSNYDFSLLSREESEELNSKLFRKLIQVIDLDRRKTCRQSIQDSHAGPNPILDQLFVVVAAYHDSVVRLLVDHVLLTSQEDLETSQAAYLILHWLKELFAPSAEATLPARRHHIYTIFNGFEVLSTANLHVRFHVMEVIDFLKNKSELPKSDGENLTSMPGFSRRLNALLVRYGGEVKAPEGDPRMVAIYRRCNQLVSSWAVALGSEASDDRLRATEELLPPLLATFQDHVDVVNQNSAELSVGELELFLECYEVLLGMVRRAACRSVRAPYLKFMLSARESPFWIVRWWAFYNVSHLVVGLPPSDDYNHTVENCLEWMLNQLYRASEPIGLKHRQCALLEFAVEGRAGARAMLRTLFKRVPPLDEKAVEDAYAEIVGDGPTAARSLADYFRKVRLLSNTILDWGHIPADA